ncbi:MAG: malate dehydrogenase [Deltaproteobacteria bacterium]|nr:malate dehydrogenase [Deltaproteobacteria bacterium]MBN2845808.1 malate dehydrogenase [Deltaproteobacteria bacterium]
MHSKVSIIGSGFVGTMAAQRTVEKNLADVVLYDIVEDLPQGKALDISQSASIEKFDGRVTGTNLLSDIEGSDIVVFTAGFPRTPGMTREELALKNAGIIKTVTEKIGDYAPDAIIIMVTNPLDVMTHLAWRVCGFPPSRVMGMGGILDTARYKYFLSRELDVSVKDIETMVLGSHGESMVPVDSYTTLKGIPVSNYIQKERLDEIIERTKKGGAEIVNLLKKGSAWHAPSASVTAMIEAIINDSKRLFPVSTYLSGEYGINGTHIGVPVLLGASGVEKIFEITLSPEELAALRESADIMKKTFEGLTIL